MGTASRLVSRSFLETSLNQSRRLLSKIIAKIAADGSWANDVCLLEYRVAEFSGVLKGFSNKHQWSFVLTSFVAKPFKGTKACPDAARH